MSAIGVFDSGVGGLTVVKALRERLPGESFLYLGDTARLPYGTKSADTVLRYTRRNVEFLVSHGVKAIVVACNTASALALEEVEAPVPLFGVIQPGAREAARLAQKRVGILGTESTIESGAYERAILALRPELEVVSQACPLFVPLVEEGWHDDPLAEEIARRYLTPVLERSVDTLVLGCTHYPLLTRTLRRVTGPDIALINSAEVISESLSQRLDELGAAGDGERAPSLRLFMTDDAQRFTRLAERILGTLGAAPEHVDV